MWSVNLRRGQVLNKPLFFLPTVVPPSSPLEHTVPLRTRHAIDTHRSRGPDYLRLTSFCQRSNPHSAATLLIGISAAPRSPPSGPYPTPALTPQPACWPPRSWAGVEQPLTTCAARRSKIPHAWLIDPALTVVTGSPRETSLGSIFASLDVWQHNCIPNNYRQNGTANRTHVEHPNCPGER
jgi:hypothetical protein